MRIAKIAALLFVLGFVLSLEAHANNNIRYVFAKLGSDGTMDYRLDGKVFKEEQLPSYFRENRAKWPLVGIELRVVFRGDVSLDWFGYGCRSFKVRGFRNIHCLVGNDGSGKAVEMNEVGPLVVLPEEKW